MQFYRNKIPTHDDYVMVKITSFNKEYGVYCELIEYNNIPAFILNNEIPKYQKNFSKHFQIGKMIPCSIYMIDGNNISLSCKKIDEELSKKLEKEYIEKHGIYRLFRHLDNFSDNKEHINEILWKCLEYINDNEIKYDEYYNKLLDNLEIIFSYDTEKKLDNIKSQYIDSLSTRIKKSDITTEIQFELLILENNFKEIINKVFNLDSTNLKISCISSPVYSFVIIGREMEDIKKEYQNYFEKLKNNLMGINHNIKYDLDNIKIIKNRTFTISFPKIEQE